MEKKHEKSNWFIQHGDTIAILSTILSCVTGCGLWIDGKFDRIDEKFSKIDDKFCKVDERFCKINDDISALSREIATIKTVLIMKNIMPAEMCKKEEGK